MYFIFTLVSCPMVVCYPDALLHHNASYSYLVQYVRSACGTEAHL